MVKEMSVVCGAETGRSVTGGSEEDLTKGSGVVVGKDSEIGGLMRGAVEEGRI